MMNLLSPGLDCLWVSTIPPTSHEKSFVYYKKQNEKKSMFLCFLPFVFLCCRAQLTGPTGPIGAQIPGIPGMPGNYGAPGTPGAVGVTGSTGANGLQGATGPNGVSPLGATGLPGQNPVIHSASLEQYAFLCQRLSVSTTLFQCEGWTERLIYLTNKSTLDGPAGTSSAIMLAMGVVNITLKSAVSSPVQLGIRFPTPVVFYGSIAPYSSCSSAVSSVSLSTAFNISPIRVSLGTPGVVTLYSNIYSWSPVNSSLLFSYMIMYWANIAPLS